MFNINLYTLNKRDNSTKRPTGSGAVFSCLIKSESSILTPTVEVTKNPINYNYAYIDVFNRYYYITDIVFNEGIWLLYLRCDVLATYKNTIGSTQLYVLRSSAQSNGDIIDSMYTTKSNTIVSKTDIVKLHNAIPGQGGSIVCGVVAKSDGIASLFQAQYGGVKFLAFSKSGLSTLSDTLLDADSLQNVSGLEDTESANIELQKSLIDPMQYIKTAVWIPVSIGTSSKTLDINGWSVPNIDYGYVPLIPINEESKTVTLPKHPNATARGNYLNTAPYTRLWLDAQPYGVIELDTTICANITSITLTEKIDLITGQGFLTIKTPDGTILNQLNAQLGVEVQLSQVTRGKTGSVLSGIAGFLGNLGGEKFPDSHPMAGARINVASDAWISKNSSSVGGTGGFAGVSFQWSINAEFFPVVDEDNTHNGRPLCSMNTPASLGGYMIIQDGDVPTSGTAEENAEIKRQLENGFYYE